MNIQHNAVLNRNETTPTLVCWYAVLVSEKSAAYIKWWNWEIKIDNSPEVRSSKRPSHLRSPRKVIP